MRLDIYNDSDKVGVLEQTATNRFVFTYLPGVRPGLAVSLLMPVRLESWVHHELHPVFQVSLPEGALRQTLTRMFSKRFDRFGEIELLSVVGAGLIGRLKALPEGTAPPGDPPADNFDQLLACSREDLLSRYFGERVRFSGVSGGFPKFLSKSPIAETSKASLVFDRWIIKIDTDDAPCLSLNEYFGLQVARRAGLAVPDFVLSEDCTHLAIKRFDQNERGWRGFEDMCAMLGLSAAEKFSGSVEKVIRTITDHCAPANQVRRARDQFFAQYMLCSVIRNGDAHLKNFGLLYDRPDEVEMAPVYDMLSMAIYAPHAQNGDADDTMALSFNGTKRWLTAKAVEELADRCMLSKARKTGIIQASIKAILATARELQRKIGERPAQFAAAGCRMLELWSHGAQVLDERAGAQLRDRHTACLGLVSGQVFPPGRVRPVASRAGYIVLPAAD